MENESKIESLIKEAIKNLDGLIDTSLVVGKEVSLSNGVKIVPVSKVTLGYVSGGGEYGKVDKKSINLEYPFSGGSGAVVSMKPYGFLTFNNGKIEYVSAPQDVYEKILNKAESVIKDICDEK